METKPNKVLLLESLVMGELQGFQLFSPLPKRSSGNQQPRNVQFHVKKIKSWVCACHYLHPEGG